MTGSDTSSDPRRRGGAFTAQVSAAVDVLGAEAHLGAPGAAWLSQSTARAVEVLGVRGEVRVRVVDDGRMARAHEQYAGQPGTTDVLTFDLSEEPGVLDADLLVCADEGARQARARGHAPERELLLYVIHGLLHCLGHDDHDPAGAAAMHAREDEVLEAIGVGATYARGDQA